MPESPDVVRAHLRESAEVTSRTADACADDIARAVSLIARAIAGGGKVLLCGNGGSAADAQHMAAEFVGRLTKDFPRPGIPAIALTTDTSVLTALANDNDFADVFARQVATLGRPGDVLIGISTSGRSANVVQAAVEARARGLVVVVLTGIDGELTTIADVAVKVPSGSSQHIQESHLAIEHAMCHLIERRLHGSAAHASSTEHA